MGRSRAGALPEMRRHHKGCARVRIGGVEHWLGPWGSAEAQAKYDCLVAEYLASGRRKAPTASIAQPKIVSAAPPPPADVTLGELAVRWLEWIQQERADWKSSSKWHGARAAIRAISRWRDTPARVFGPRLFQQVRVELAGTPIYRKKREGSRVEVVSVPRSRRYVLDTMNRVRQLIGFGVSQELIPGDRLHSLVAVPNLPGNIGAARPKVRPVPLEHYAATIEHLTPATRAIVEFIFHTGCRPDEAAGMTMADIEEQDQPVWKYEPKRHKNKWRGQSRPIAIGPAAQAIVLEAAAGRDPTEPVFNPRESIRGARGTKRTASTRKTSPRVSNTYATATIRNAIVRAAKSAGVPQWTTYQLRHLRISAARRDDGMEAAQAVAGHSQSKMVERYAPPSWEAAVAYAAVHG